MAITGKWQDCAALLTNDHRFDDAFRFVASVLSGHGDAAAALAGLAEGGPTRIEIDGDRTFATIQCARLKVETAVPLESHRHYADVQVVVDGRETMDIVPASDLTSPDGYDPARDLLLYPRVAADATRLFMGSGRCAVLFPADAHAPQQAADASPGLSRRIVVKVRVADA